MDNKSSKHSDPNSVRYGLEAAKKSN